jgi:DNA repair exonuclease SbcCD ATPase subunit
MILFSCNQDKIDQLNEEKEEYRNEVADKDSTINDMLKTFNDIQTNLDEIKTREGILSVSNPEDEENTIVRDIQAINQLMKENEKLRDQLNRKLRNSDVKMSEFRKMIAKLNREIEDKNREIAELNEILQRKDARIGQLYFSLDSMNSQVEQREQEIQETKDDLNTAYYAYGTFDELEEREIVTKEGGFLGLGKTESLIDNVNLDYFTKVDIRKQKSFLIYAKEAELLSKHPEGSYEFRGEEKVDSLVITDPEAFWKASKLMVVLIE